MGFDPFSKKSWEKTFGKGGKEIAKPFEQAANELKKVGRDLEKEMRKIESGVKKEGSNIYNMSQDLKKQLEKESQKALHTVEDAFEKKLPALLDKALKDLAGALTKEGLKKIRNLARRAKKQMGQLEKKKPALVGAINGLSFYVELGPVKLGYSGFYARSKELVSVLDSYVNAPPAFRRGPLLDFMRATGPSSVDTGLSVQVVAVVVGSKELGIGGGLNDIDPELALELLDVILEEMGVPE